MAKEPVMFLAISNRIPSVFTVDSTRQQANARAGWNARRYGVSVSVVANKVAPKVCSSFFCNNALTEDSLSNECADCNTRLDAIALQAEEDYLRNHQHIYADTPDGRQCRICYYS